MIRLFRHIIFLILFCISTIHAENVSDQSLEILTVGVDSRSLGMAGTVEGACTSAMAVLWNPALIQSTQNTEVGIMHNWYIQNIRYQYAVISTHIHPDWTFAASFIHINSNYSFSDSLLITPDIDSVSMAKIVHFCPNLTIAHKLTDHVNIGFTLKPVFRSIQNYYGQVIAIEGGLNYSTNRFGYGIAFRNFGPHMVFLNQNLPLPLVMSSGITYRFPSNSQVAIAIEKSSFSDVIVKTGFESRPFEYFTIRGGYILSSLKNKIWGAPGLALGFGIHYKQVVLNYSSNFIGFVGNSYSVSLSYAFNNELEVNQQNKENNIKQEKQRIKTEQIKLLGLPSDNIKKKKSHRQYLILV